MDYKKEVVDNILNLEISGDLIGENNGPGLVELLNDHINKGITKCIIDISGVRYMNSSGIGVLITKLNNIFTIYNSKEEAIASLK